MSSTWAASLAWALSYAAEAQRVVESHSDSLPPAVAIAGYHAERALACLHQLLDEATPTDRALVQAELECIARHPSEVPAYQGVAAPAATATGEPTA